MEGGRPVKKLNNTQMRLIESVLSQWQCEAETRDERDFCSIFVDLLGIDGERKVWVKDDSDISTLGGR